MYRQNRIKLVISLVSLPYWRGFPKNDGSKGTLLRTHLRLHNRIGYVLWGYFETKIWRCFQTQLNRKFSFYSSIAWWAYLHTYMCNIVTYITYIKMVMRSTKLVKKGEVTEVSQMWSALRQSVWYHQRQSSGPSRVVSLSWVWAGVRVCGPLACFRCQRSFQDPNVDSRHAVITQSEYRRINKHPRSAGHNSCFVCSSGGALAGERPRALLTALCTVSPSHSGPGSALSHWTAVN